MKTTNLTGERIKKYLDEGHRIICVDNLQTTFTPKNIECFFTAVQHAL